MSYPSHNYNTRNNTDMLLPYPRVEAIRMNFRYQFVKVWRRIPEYIKCQRRCAKKRSLSLSGSSLKYKSLKYEKLEKTSTLG